MAGNVVTAAHRLRVVPQTYVKDNWDDDWGSPVPYLWCTFCNRRVPPDTSRAQFLYRFGRQHRADRVNTQTYRYQDLIGKWVRVDALHPTGATERLFTGSIEDETLRFKVEDNIGFQRPIAYGVERTLQQRTIEHAYVDNPNKGAPLTVPKHKLNWAPSFNQPKRAAPFISTQPDRVPNALDSLRGNRELGAQIFSTDGEVWGAWEVLEYLTDNDHTAIMPDLRQTGVNDWTFSAPGLFDALSVYYGVWPQQGMTPFDLLTSIFNRKKGLMWFVNVTPGDDRDGFEIVVKSIFGTDTTIGGITFPANDSITDYIVTTHPTEQHFYKTPNLKTRGVEAMDELTVQGPLIKVCCNFSYDFDENIEEDWPNALQLEYDTLKPVERTDDEFASVYQHHRVPDDWNFTVRNVHGGTGPFIVSPYTNGNGLVSFALFRGHYFVGGKRFLRYLPFVEGIDYTQDPLVNLFDDEYELKYQRPWAAFEQPTNAGFYMYSDRMRDIDDDLDSAHMSLMEDRLGVMFDHRHNDFFSLNSFAGSDPLAYRVDYTSLVVCAFFETDQRQHITEDLQNRGTNLRPLTITVPDAEYWYVAPETFIKISDDGTLRQIHPNHLVLRDSLSRLWQVMAFAREWFRVPRRPITLPVKGISADIPISLPIGSYLRDYIDKTVTVPINTIVTGQDWNFRRQTTDTKTSFHNLDTSIEMALGI